VTILMVLGVYLLWNFFDSWMPAIRDTR
jgi:hypothetical protein